MSSSLRVIGIEDGVFMGRSIGFGGTIKRRPSDFVVSEIDVQGREVEVSSFEVPPTLHSAALTSPSAAVVPAVSAATTTLASLTSASTSTPTPTSASASASASTSTSATRAPLLSCARTAVNPGDCAATADGRDRGGHDDGLVSSGRHPGEDDVTAPPAAALKNGAGVTADGEGDKEGGSNANWLQQLRRCLEGSESKLAQLERLNATARGPDTTTAGPGPKGRSPAKGSTEGSAGASGANSEEVGLSSKASGILETVESAANSPGTSSLQDTGDALSKTAAVGRTTKVDDGELDKAVRIPLGQGADKAARARVHLAVQETFPFIKTTTERAPDGSVSVVCSQAKPLPALRKLLSGPELEALQRMVNRGPGGEGADLGITFSSDKDRAERTLVHRAVAEAFPYLHTKTVTDVKDQQSQRLSVFWSRRRGKGGGGGNKRKRQGSSSKDDDSTSQPRRGHRGEGPRDRWVRFSLRKEGCEHHRTALAVSKVLRVPLSALTFGGIKDKTAITTQACVVKGVFPRKILEINGSIPGVTVGNLAYCDRGLSLGELSGNKFSIVIRDANVSARDVKYSLEEACLGGFVNFFGTQRVGSPSAAARGQPLPYQIGRDILAGDWGGAVAKILVARDGDPPFLSSALSDLMRGKITPKECASRVRGSNRLSVERSVLQGLVRYGASAFEAAIQCVPFSMRTMWVHAYQSHVWNSLACARIRKLGCEAVPGDLILLPDQDESPPPTRPGHDSDRFVERVSPPDPTGGVGDSPLSLTAPIVRGPSSATGVGALTREHAEPSGITGAKGERTTPGGGPLVNDRRRETVGILTSQMMEKFASDGITPRDLLRGRVVLPLAGTSVSYPLHEIGNMYRQRLEGDGVHPQIWPELRPDPEESIAAAVTPSTTAEPGNDAAPPLAFPPSELPISVRPVRGDVPSAVTIGPCSRATSSNCHSEPWKQRCDGEGGGGDGGENAAAATTATKPVPTSSSLVPRGAYRRLVCVPADASWESAAAAVGDEDGDGSGRTADERPVEPAPDPPRGAPKQPQEVVLSSCSGAAAPVAGTLRDTVGVRRIPSTADARQRSASERETMPATAAAAAVATTDELSAYLSDVRVTFTLPPGSFATMFLREVMRRNEDIVWEGSVGTEDEEWVEKAVKVTGL